MSPGPAGTFRAAPAALLRIAHHWRAGELDLPDLVAAGEEAAEGRAAWLRRVWAMPGVAESLGHASPALHEQVRQLCAAAVTEGAAVSGAVLSTVRYLARISGRPTPVGLLAGVAPAVFGELPTLDWGTEHCAVARADGRWLADFIGQLEGDAQVLRSCRVVANSALSIRGARLIVPYQPLIAERGTGAAEVSLRFTAVVRTAVDAARTPLRFEDLARKVADAHPAAERAKVDSLLTELVARNVLVTDLRAPSTETDALRHLVAALERGGARAPLLVELRAIHDLLGRHATAGTDQADVREEAARRMRGLARGGRHPVAVDLRLDARGVLPPAVAREAERAAQLLARLSTNPYGSDTLREYHQRFYRRFGTGALVPLLDVVADSGIGWPAGYPGTEPLEPRRENVRRDGLLAALAQRAALLGTEEVVLDGAVLGELEAAGSGQVQLPPHLELCVRVDAASAEALGRGSFRLVVLSVARAAGVMTGRFLDLLDDGDRKGLADELAGLPAADSDTLTAQLSFPPLDPSSAHVTRTPQYLPRVVSVAEHRDPCEEGVLTPVDLAVGCDGQRLFLAVPALGRRLEAWGLHALNLRKHTPPLAALITELSRGQCAQVTDFDWGTAANLPFLPRVRYRRIVLAPAQWRVEAADLPTSKVPFAVWEVAFTAWSARLRLPAEVLLADGGDWRLPLDLRERTHQVLLREHLRTRGHARLIEAPGRQAAGWCGGRPHELVIPLAAERPAPWPRLPRPTMGRVIDPSHVHSPGTSPVLLAALYGDRKRQDTIITEHLPHLMTRWTSEQVPSRWWFLRYRQGSEDYLRLHLVLPHSGPAAFGEAAATVGCWADELRRLGLARDLTFNSVHPANGRWGSGPALIAAEQVFAADSDAVLTQLNRPAQIHRLALIAANFIAMAAAFTGGISMGTRWLIEQVPSSAPPGVPRQVFTQAVRLADPRGEFAALRAEPGGQALVDGWAHRTTALMEYRGLFPGPDTGGVDVDAVLGSLLHTHFLRAYGIEPADKVMCLYLARAAALAHTARTRGM